MKHKLSSLEVERYLLLLEYELCECENEMCKYETHHEPLLSFEEEFLDDDLLEYEQMNHEPHPILQNHEPYPGCYDYD